MSEIIKDENYLKLKFELLLKQGNLVIGQFKVIFSDFIAFKNGGGVFNYVLQEVNDYDTKNVVYAKDFFTPKQEIQELKKNVTYEIYGRLQNDTYKDRNGEWINKGGYINIKVIYEEAENDTRVRTKNNL